ncbi:unnamed protein product [Protopolystoma xenopodis]|uniref:Uncharacterized protein n=1 Tax=Protopolystoma xenopodis TaxID=117903 RepID=A0A3S5AXW7_9PLAT|nr:unnamed protein product [Protopolystoma xenopodis]
MTSAVSRGLPNAANRTTANPLRLSTQSSFEIDESTPDANVKADSTSTSSTTSILGATESVSLTANSTTAFSDFGATSPTKFVPTESTSLVPKLDHPFCSSLAYAPSLPREACITCTATGALRMIGFTMDTVHSAPVTSTIIQGLSSTSREQISCLAWSLELMALGTRDGFLVVRNFSSKRTHMRHISTLVRSSGIDSLELFGTATLPIGVKNISGPASNVAGYSESQYGSFAGVFGAASPVPSTGGTGFSYGYTASSPTSAASTSASLTSFASAAASAAVGSTGLVPTSFEQAQFDASTLFLTFGKSYLVAWHGTDLVASLISEALVINGPNEAASLLAAAGLSSLSSGPSTASASGSGGTNFGPEAIRRVKFSPFSFCPGTGRQGSTRLLLVLSFEAVMILDPIESRYSSLTKSA